MLFHSQPFILGFLPICLAGFFLLGRAGGARWALRWLVAASLVFYAWWNPPFVLLLAGSILVNYALGQKILRLAAARLTASARRWLTAGIAANLLLLGWFKYADFLLHAFAPGAPALHGFLPLAISFFTFQQIMFLVDSYRWDRQATGFLPYAAFVAFFPHLIAGPIVRPNEILPQLTTRALARPDPAAIATGLTLFLLGLAKKLVLADNFGGFADTGFAAAADGAALTLFEAWYATLAYALQIYFDFSGYSDMAIGIARMLNVRFPANFDSPYQATTIAAFWRRWHMTLGRFLRDYLYIPLGGNRAGERRRLLNLMLTMLLGGLWHGAAWGFVVWGGLHGLFLILHAAWQRTGLRLPSPIAHALTLAAVVIAWVPFRADGLDSAGRMLAGMAGMNGAALPAMIVRFLPPLGWVATPVPVLPHLGDARTLSFPEVSACLLFGWWVVLALPNVQRMTERARNWANHRRVRVQRAGAVLRPECRTLSLLSVLMTRPRRRSRPRRRRRCSRLRPRRSRPRPPRRCSRLRTRRSHPRPRCRRVNPMRAPPDPPPGGGRGAVMPALRRGVRDAARPPALAGFPPQPD